MQSFCWPFHGVFFDQTKRRNAAEARCSRFWRCVMAASKTFNEQQNSVRNARDEAHPVATSG
jgi:hypothetical protein